MKVILINNFTKEEINTVHIKSDELSVALLCKSIIIHSEPYIIQDSEMVIPTYSPIVNSSPYVTLTVSEL